MLITKLKYLATMLWTQDMEIGSRRMTFQTQLNGGAFFLIYKSFGF